jgi:uncharacterized paraquat-inducible protein A
MSTPVITLPAEERARCPRCNAMAAVINLNTTACANCGATIRVDE